MKKSTSSRRPAKKAAKSQAGGKSPAAKITKTGGTKTGGRRNAGTKTAPVKSGGTSPRTDPHFAREQLKYESPVPSRELILDTLHAQGVPVDDSVLHALLHVTASEMEGFERRLGAMQRDGQIMRNRRGAICVVTKMDLITGTIQGHPDGFGFLTRDDSGPDLFIGPHEMAKVLHGDRVAARESGTDRRGRPEGKIVEVLSRANTRVVGRLHNEHGVLIVIAENKRISQDFLVPPGESMKAKPGNVVVAEIIEQPAPHVRPVARVVEVLGNYVDPGMEIEIALRKHDLPYVFPPAVERASSAIVPRVSKQDMAGRADLRKLPLVTIDGETARDFDDAVYAEPKGKGYRLVVAIADVSHYVRPGDALDIEAKNRGNSVYFPRRVIPMLPEVLSNGLCSLNPEVDRLCMVCDMTVDGRGEITDYTFYPAVMWSHARLTYTSVAAMLAEPKGALAAQNKRLLPHLQHLHALYQLLLKARLRRGAIDFDSAETQMIFDANGKIERIVPVVRNDAHRLIEECMLAANVCTSGFLHCAGHPVLYRVHEGPTPERLAALRQFLGGFGLQIGGGDKPQAGDYADTLLKCKGRPEAPLLQMVMLRSLRQAVYSPDNRGHFGLAYEGYTHFTSPIRRYPDLLVHRAIKAVLEGNQYKPGSWKDLGIHCSMTERRADEATRDVDAWLKCYYMRDRVGESFAGTVSSAVAFGVFVSLDGLYVEGLVHVSDLGSDYFHFDAAKHMLLGERTGRRFRIGDRVHVKVVRVDIETSKIDFVLDD